MAPILSITLPPLAKAADAVGEEPKLELGERGEDGSVAYSEPMLGRTFSEAERETKRAKGTSQMRRKK